MKGWMSKEKKTPFIYSHGRKVQWSHSHSVIADFHYTPIDFGHLKIEWPKDLPRVDQHNCDEQPTCFPKAKYISRQIVKRTPVKPTTYINWKEKWDAEGLPACIRDCGHLLAHNSTVIGRDFGFEAAWHSVETPSQVKLVEMPVDVEDGWVIDESKSGPGFTFTSVQKEVVYQKIWYPTYHLYDQQVTETEWLAVHNAQGEERENLLGYWYMKYQRRQAEYSKQDFFEIR